jgi:hypothetical protein
MLVTEMHPKMEWRVKEGRRDDKIEMCFEIRWNVVNGA